MNASLYSADRIHAAELLRDTAVHHGIRLAVLVAETGLWAHPEVHRRLSMESESGAYFPNRRRYRPGQGEERGQKLGDLVLDDNSYANVAIKRAIGIEPERLIGFEACHIWPRTCYDARYHTSIANLVLLPRALAGLTDHDTDVQRALQYRAFELYRWHPTEEPQPTPPPDYPTTWLEPFPFSDAVALTLAKHTIKGLRHRGLDAARDDSRATPVVRDYTRYDVRGGSTSFPRLPKRITMLRLVKALVEAGVHPSEIAAAVPSLGPRLFSTAEGHLDSDAFVAALKNQRAGQGRRFDPIRYFCGDDELIHVNGWTYALTSQWGGWTQESLEALLQAFPDRGVSVVPTS